MDDNQTKEDAMNHHNSYKNIPTDGKIFIVNYSVFS